MKRDYSIFTKAELVAFLNENGEKFLYIEKPYDVLLHGRLKETDKKISENIRRSAELSEKLKNKPSLASHKAWLDNHREWERLNKERDKIESLLFPA